MHLEKPSPGILALALYVLALIVPALVIIDQPLFGSGSHDQTLTGFQCAIAGWIIWPPWLANPLLFFAAIALLCRWRNVAAVLATVAIGLAATTPLFLHGMLRYPHVGFFLWIASMVMTLVAALRQPAKVAATS